VGKTLRGSSANGGRRRRAVTGRSGLGRLARAALLVVALCGVGTLRAQEPERLDRGRFTAVFYPTERVLATSLLENAVRTDTFPGLPRPAERVLLELAPDKRRFREWVGPGAPEWGAAITFPDQRRIVMQGRSSGSDAGVPSEVFRHELAHLALHEFLGDLPPRWFDEGYASYAAREWTRDDALAANVGLALRGAPTFDELDSGFSAGTMTAQTAYALSYRAVVELASLDPSAGLAPFLKQWKSTGSLDRAMRSSYGLTLVGFEGRWRERTRRRYGALALVSDAALGGLLILVVVFPLYVARRQRDRRRLAEMVAADEAAERAARASVIEALLRGDDLPDRGAESPPSPPS
jgi:hypothetical protein